MTRQVNFDRVVQTRLPQWVMDAVMAQALPGETRAAVVRRIITESIIRKETEDDV